MADDYRPEDEHNLGAQGPRRQDSVDAERRLANDLGDQADDQTNPTDSRVWEPEETGTAGRAERAAGVEAHEQHQRDSVRAFEESRGTNEPRPDPRGRRRTP